MRSYSFFARFYDSLTQNVDYQKRAKYFDTIIRQQNQGAGLLLDLACGTGSLSVELAALGYEVIGADSSGEMLSVAMQKAMEQQQQILFLCQPMERLDLYGTVNACVCALDSFNHLPSEIAFDKVASRLRLFIEPGGILVFDLNTAYKHRYQLADNAYIYETPEVYCVWQNRYHDENDRIDITLDFFEPDDQGQYIRTQEQFSERIYEDDFVKQTLQKNGFAFIQVYGDDTFSPPGPATERLVYVFKRRED